MIYKDLIIDVKEVGGDDNLLLEPRSNITLEHFFAGNPLPGFHTTELSFFDEIAPQGDVPLLDVLPGGCVAVRRDHPIAEWSIRGMYSDCVAFIEKIRPLGEHVFLDLDMCSQRTNSLIDFKDSSFDIIDSTSWFYAPNQKILSTVTSVVDVAALKKKWEDENTRVTFVPVKLNLIADDLPPVLIFDDHFYVREDELAALPNASPGAHRFDVTLS